MTIVRSSTPRRRRSKPAAQLAAVITGPRIVTHTPKRRYDLKPIASDPEAQRAVAAFLRRMGLQVPEDPTLDDETADKDGRSI